jgi:hypothetical protein
MSLPGSERLPSDINDLPPARQRHIRRQPRSVSPAERQMLLDSIIKLTSPTPAFFLRTLLGALILGTAFYLQSLIFLIIAIVVFPFQTPLFGLVLFPLTFNNKHAFKVLISLLLLIALAFIAGLVPGFFQTLNFPDPLGVFRFSALYWLDMFVIAFSTFIGVLILLRRGKKPQEMGALISYTLLVPIALVGFGLSSRNATLWQGALFVSLEHLGLALVFAILSFTVFGFPPQKALGWIIVITTFAITLAINSLGLNFSMNQPPHPSIITRAPTRPINPTENLAVPTEPRSSPTILPTNLSFTPTHLASPTSTPAQLITATSTSESTRYWGIVNSATGAVVRMNPDFSAEIVTYVNDGDLIEILDELTAPNGSLWYQIKAKSGQSGWLLGSLLKTQTPSPKTDD